PAPRGHGTRVARLPPVPAVGPAAGRRGGRRVRSLLVVTAVDAERDAIAAGWPGEVVAVGVGVAAAAAGTARLLAGNAYGAVISVATVTGTAAGLRALAGRHPDAVAEGMEGFGVATAAAGAGVPFAEVRTISNPVGPRDREAWRIGDALAALTEVGRALGKLGP